MVASGVRVISPDPKNPGGMIQEQAETTAVWSDAFCGAGLTAMFAWALELKAGWNDTKVERLLIRVQSICSDRVDRPIVCRCSMAPEL
jgi:hypothetical protein